MQGMAGAMASSLGSSRKRSQVLDTAESFTYAIYILAVSEGKTEQDKEIERFEGRQVVEPVMRVRGPV